MRLLAWESVVAVLSRWMTSAQVGALVLPDHDAGTGLVGRALGVCQLGGPFVFDPFDAYRAGLVANPNVLVTGSIGVGKSTAVKMLVARGLDAGRAAVVLDPKGEYHDLAAACRGAVVALGAPGGWCDPFAGARTDLALLETVLATAMGRALADDERFCLERTARASARDAPGVLARMLGVLAPHLDERRPSPERTLALALRRFVEGDLAGLFDGPGAPEELRNRLVVLDLSASWGGERATLCALAAMAVARSSLGARTGAGYLVVDEAWALVAEPRVAHWLRGSWKLARASATSHVLVLHRWSDAFAAADEGSAQRAQVTSILRDCDTDVLLRQDPTERALLADVLGLRAREREALTSLPRGAALVRYGPHRSLVRFVPDGDDLAVIDTDAAMRR